MRLAMNPVSVSNVITSDTQANTIQQPNFQVNTLSIVSDEVQPPEDANPMSVINLARLLASCGDCV